MRFVIVASDLFDSDEEIEQKYDDGISKRSISNLGDELTVDAIRNIEGLTRTINNILANRKIIKENYDVVKVELKPLDIFSYCKNAFEKCSKI
jgi:ATP-dependent DNA helicase DinG